MGIVGCERSHHACLLATFLEHVHSFEQSRQELLIFFAQVTAVQCHLIQQQVHAVHVRVIVVLCARLARANEVSWI